MQDITEKILFCRFQSWPVPVVNDEFEIDVKADHKEGEICLHRLPAIPEGDANDNPTFEPNDEIEL